MFFRQNSHLVIVDIVSPDPLAGDKLGDVVAVVVEEDGHGGEEGRPEDDSHRAQHEGARPRGEAEAAGTENRHHAPINYFTR